MEEAANDVPRFIADAMLGKLARWLRALGYDTLYIQGDDYLVAACTRVEGRILLTRDTELARRKGLRVLLITSQSLRAQITQVVQTFGHPVDTPSPRCMNCNGELKSLTVEQARPLVPVYVAQTQKVFHQCSNCGQVYWQGTHWQGIQKLRRTIWKSIED
jgi:uncharacterized protein with PIN domain